MLVIEGMKLPRAWKNVDSRNFEYKQESVDDIIHMRHSYWTKKGWIPFSEAKKGHESDKVQLRTSCI